mmetsp:Transcript_390/g.897  ORF Transcript_390/g.897 Transcript_390/m.897 type:complete len:290 (+) Transcript_390:369-1238(+)
MEAMDNEETAADLEDDAANGPCCRFCYQGEAPDEEPLIAPCNCTGTIRFVHASCLNQWRMLNLDNERRFRCQLCQARFRLVRDEKSVWRKLIPLRYVYEGLIRVVSGSALIPLSFGALYLSRYFKRDDLYVHGPGDLYARPWRRRTFGCIIPRQTLEDINLFIIGADPKRLSRLALIIYGLIKLGSYGCTFWLFTDGLADILPTQVIGPNGDVRQSPSLAILKAILEFYIIPFFLRTPQSRLKVPFFFFCSGLGIAFIWSNIHNTIRAFLLRYIPAYRQLELGQLETRV